MGMGERERETRREEGCLQPSVRIPTGLSHTLGGCEVCCSALPVTDCSGCLLTIIGDLVEGR